MTTMIEKMARALCETDANGLTYEQQARAALEAIREPNDGPVEVVEIGVGYDYTQNGIRGVFARMIDAILNEEATDDLD